MLVILTYAIPTVDNEKAQNDGRMKHEIFKKFAFERKVVGKLKKLDETKFHQKVASRIQIFFVVRIFNPKVEQQLSNSELSTFANSVWSILIAGFYNYVLQDKKTSTAQTEFSTI